MTYWGANGITNTDSASTSLKRSSNEVGQNITITVVVNGIIVLNTTKVTNENGTIVLDVVSSNFTVTARHDADSYYTEIEKTETFAIPANKTNLEVSVLGFNVTAKISPGDITGNVTFIVENESGVVKTVESVLKDGVAELDLHGLKSGKYNITATYGGTYPPSPNKKTRAASQPSTLQTKSYSYPYIS